MLAIPIVEQASPYLITGGSGFLGKHLLDELSGNDKPVTVLVRDKSAWDNLPWVKTLKRVGCVNGTLESLANCAENIGPLGGIFHLAARVEHRREHSAETMDANINGLLSVIRLAAANNCCRVVYVSTSGAIACFSDKESYADENSDYCTETVKEWPYYLSKIRSEIAGTKLAKELGVPLVILRPPILLGPGDDRGRSTTHVKRIMSGKLPFMIRGGINFTDVRDVAAALVNAMIIANPRPVYNLPGTACQISEFFKMVQLEFPARRPISHLPASGLKVLAQLNKFFAKKLPFYSGSFLPDPVIIEMATKYWGMRSLYAEEINYRPRNPKLTLSDTVRWIQSHNTAPAKF